MAAIGGHLAASATGPDVNIFEALGRALRTGPSGHSLMLFSLGAAAVMGAIVVIFYFWNRKPRSVTNPQADLFTAAIDLLPLSSVEKGDLAYVAHQRRERCVPVAMLLSPRNLAIAVERACPDKGDDDRRSRLSALCRKLFDESMPDAGPQPGVSASETKPV